MENVILVDLVSLSMNKSCGVPALMRDVTQVTYARRTQRDPGFWCKMARNLSFVKYLILG